MIISNPTPEMPAENQLSRLGLLDKHHVATFRNALDKVLLTEASESTYAEIVDGLPTPASRNDFHYWVPGKGNPIKELENKELCTGSREKARKLRSEFDVYTMRHHDLAHPMISHS
ncbi:hypothetical protein diail_3236 [Diaporthe ilicicola]|nr:hypothetical protein diail_3236 [Diaporthe ilicicola]